MDITTLKLRRQTLKRLKLLAALTEKTMMDVLDEMVEEKLAQLGAPPRKEPPPPSEPENPYRNGPESPRSFVGG
jgi:hypothetical protein